MHAVGAASPIPVATGEMYDTVGQFFTLADGRRRQHLSARADVARRHRQHPRGRRHRRSPTAARSPRTRAAARSPPRSACSSPPACPNFLIQEHFDAFNDTWTRDLVTWRPTIDPANGHLSLPEAPGLGIDLNLDVARAHPYDPKAYLNVYAEGWEKRVGGGTEINPILRLVLLDKIAISAIWISI